MPELALALLVTSLAISIINTCLILNARDSAEDLKDKFDLHVRQNAVFREDLERLVSSHNLMKWEQAEKLEKNQQELGITLRRVNVYSEDTNLKINTMFNKKEKLEKPEPKKLNWRQKKKLNEQAKLKKQK